MQEKEQPTFDASEFPALGGAVRGAAVRLPNGDTGSAGTLDGANLYANLGVHKGMLPSEFNMQNEEFPALPGSSARASEDERPSAEQPQNGPASQARGHAPSISAERFVVLQFLPSVAKHRRNGP